MCGITGIYNFNESKVDESHLRKFNDSLAHRGPNGSGIAILNDGKIGFGHRRLSILDLSEDGKQPMSYLNSRYTITYNGEVFNFLELRKELEASGYSFKTETDTEVILAAYDCWGLSGLNKFNGMWALAIWDSAKRELIISRDRYGIKPLYYVHEKGKAFYFASETLAFKNLEGYTRAFDNTYVQYALGDPYLLQGANCTIYKGIYSVGAGEVIVINQDNFKKKKWYSLIERATPKTGSLSDLTEEYLDLFQSSVSLRLRSDVSIATALSGGLDSSSVFAMVNSMNAEGNKLERSPKDFQRAFIGVFPGSELDETEYAKRVVEHFNAPHDFIDVTKGDLSSDIESSTVYSDSISSTPLISLAGIYRGMGRAGYSISLDGHGADELLCGYRGMIFDLFDRARIDSDTEKMTMLAHVLSRLSAPDQTESLLKRLMEDVATQKNWKTKLKRGVKSVIGSDENLGFKGNVDPIVLDDAFNSLNYPEQLSHWHFSHYTLPSLLRDFDKASMMSSIEIRMPFMDYRLVEFCMGLPLEMKVNHGFTKYILRQSMKNFIPDTVVSRTHKIGLQSPLANWFENDLSEFIRDHAGSKSFVENSHFDGTALKNLSEKASKDGWSNAEATKVWKSLNLYMIQL